MCCHNQKLQSIKHKGRSFYAAAFDETLLNSTNSAKQSAAHRTPNWAQCDNEMFHGIQIKHG
jgi:negative regulator of replication initiation